MSQNTNNFQNANPSKPQVQPQPVAQQQPQATVQPQTVYVQQPQATVQPQTVYVQQPQTTVQPQTVYVQQPQATVQSQPVYVQQPQTTVQSQGQPVYVQQPQVTMQPQPVVQPQSVMQPQPVYVQVVNPAPSKTETAANPQELNRQRKLQKKLDRAPAGLIWLIVLLVFADLGGGLALIVSLIINSAFPV